jgi:hypothetical protein
VALLGALALGLLAGDDAARAGGQKEPGQPQADERLIVHEWGTFTSMHGLSETGLATTGASATGLEGLQHEEEALPEFVYSRSEVRACPLRKQGWKGLEVPASHVTRKMETPVIYVHSAKRRDLKVRVDMVGGLISQWYPVTDTLGPPELACDDGPLDLRKVERSFLEWDLEVVPRSEPAPMGIPRVAADDPWAFAREVDSAWLVTKPRQGPDRDGPVEAEHYLFYRGLGTFTLPFEGRALGKGRVRFANTSPQRVSQVVTLEVGAAGTTARYTVDGTLDPAQVIEPDLGAKPFAPLEQVLPGLEADVTKILRGQGLHADEARAMVRTWSRSWFRSEGLRCIYTVPREVTDAILPLTITPKPDHVVRVLVGRLELIAPETQAEVETALLDARAEDEAQRARGEARLARLDRFLEPHLRDILASERADPRARKLAAIRLESLTETRR